MVARKKKTRRVIREFVSARELRVFELLSAFLGSTRETETIGLAHFSSRATRMTVLRLTGEDKKRGIVRKESYRSYPYITVDLVITRHDGSVMTSAYDEDGHSVDTIRVKPTYSKKLTGKRLRSL